MEHADAWVLGTVIGLSLALCLIQTWRIKEIKRKAAKAFAYWKQGAESCAKEADSISNDEERVGFLHGASYTYIYCLDEMKEIVDER